MNDQNRKNYLTMDINEFEELPFTMEGSLEGQADPTLFFEKGFRNFISEGKKVLVILPQSDVRRAMAFVMKRLGAEVCIASPDDSFNYMLNVIHGHEQAGRESGFGYKKEGSARSAAQNVSVLAGSVESLKGLLKHSAEISVSEVLISDSYIPQSFVSDLEKAWDCKVYEHYTRPEFGGLGAMSCGQDKGYHVCDELYIEIIDPETGLVQPDGKWGEVVVTSMFKAKYPMIRYRTGDVSRYLKEECACSSSMPRLDRIRRQGAMG